MLYNHLESQEIVLNGPQSEFLLLGQGLTALRIAREEQDDLGPGFGPKCTVQEIDETFGKLPPTEITSVAITSVKEVDRLTTVTFGELHMLCAGLRQVRRDVRRSRTVLGAFSGPVVDQLDKQSEAYLALHGQLIPALKPAKTSTEG